jgi:hypothetical protein
MFLKFLPTRIFNFFLPAAHLAHLALPLPTKLTLRKAKRAKFLPTQRNLLQRELILLNYTYLCLKQKEIDY